MVALFVDALWERDLQLDASAYYGIAIVFAGLAISLLTRRRVAA
jgi:hypothetical protein